MRDMHKKKKAALRIGIPILVASVLFVLSAPGPATGSTDLIFFISMFGEIPAVLFLYLYARAKTNGKRNENEIACGTSPRAVFVCITKKPICRIVETL